MYDHYQLYSTYRNTSDPWIELRINFKIRVVRFAPINFILIKREDLIVPNVNKELFASKVSRVDDAFVLQGAKCFNVSNRTLVDISLSKRLDSVVVDSPKICRGGYYLSFSGNRLLPNPVFY